MALAKLLAQLKSHSGLSNKQELQLVHRILSQGYPSPFPNGDDAAVIPRDQVFDLLAGEGFLPQFVEADPWFAGWCGIMVNVSDIAAMGGRPVAVVNALWGGEDATTIALLQGFSDASHCYQVPIVGGHSNLRANTANFSVSILGRAKSLLDSFSAQPGQLVIAAIDQRGAMRKPFLNWNAASEAPADRLRGDLSLLPLIAEAQLATAAKDISQAGLLGTLVMLLESAQLGADIDLESIPKPSNIDWHDWLCAFPSFGFLLTVDERYVNTVLDLFVHRDISAAVIGQLNNSKQCMVSHDGVAESFWDLNQTPLTQPHAFPFFNPEPSHA